MPRIEGESLAEHRELVRGRILDAFGAEMAESGFAELTVARVAARAGIARNTFYHYAADKEELMLSYVQRSVDEFTNRVGQQSLHLPTARERLVVLVRAQIQAFAVEPGAGSASGMLEGGSLPPEVFDALMGRLAGLHGLIRQALILGIERGEFRAVDDPQSIVEMIGAVIGSQRMPVGEGRRCVEQAVSQVVTFVLGAVAVG